MPMWKNKTPVLLFLCILLTRALGLLRTLTLSRIWGSGEEAAAFELAQTVSAFLYDTCISTVLAAMLIPAYLTHRHKSDKDRFISRLLFPVFLVCAILYLPLVIFPRTVLSLAVNGISPSLIEKTAPSLAVLSLGRVTLSLSCLFTGVLQSEGEAVKAAVFYCASSFVSLIGTTLFKSFLTAFTLSALLAFLDIALLLLLTFSIRRRHTVSMTVHRRFTLSRQSALRIFWVILSGIFLPLLTLFSSLSSADIAGSTGISLIGYASRLVLLSAALLTSVTHAAYYTAMAKATNKRKAMTRILFRLLLLSAATAVSILVFAEPIVKTVYRGSAFTKDDLQTLVLLLSVYAPSIVALTLSSLLSDLAYLQNQTAHIAIGNVCAIALAAFFFSLTDTPTLPHVPLYFTVTSYLRLFFSAITVFSKPDRERPRILLVLSDSNIGGAGRWLLTYLKNAEKKSFDIHVALPEKAALKEEIEALGFPVHEMGSDDSFSLGNTLKACRVIFRLRPDLVNTSASLSARIAAFLLRTPVRLYTRHCVYQPRACFRYRAVRLAHRAFSRLLTPSAVAVAPEAKHNLVAMGIPQKRITVIPNGVIPIIRKDAEGHRIRKRYHIDNAPTAIICARLEKDKSVDTLIRAIATLKKAGYPHHALIVGKGREEDSLKTLTNRLNAQDRVHFCGFVGDVSPYLSAADSYINCSVGSEATSLAIAEAMSLSLPIIASDYGGNPHMVKDGINGILTKQKDARELSDALLILSDPALAKRFGEASYAHYTAYYRADTMAKQYEALYKTLLHRKGYHTP